MNNKKILRIIAFSTMAILLAAIIIVAILFLNLDKPQQVQITGFATQEQGYTYCKDYDFEDQDLEQHNLLRPCLAYKDTIVSEMANLGLLDTGIDPLLIISLAQQESSCTSPNARGVLQVDGCANGNLYCPDETTRIREGLKIFKKNYEELQTMGISGEELIQLTLFAYNRGLQTAKNANQKLEQGFALQEAMVDSCAEVFSKQCYGTETYCRYTSYREDKCTGEGLGAGYPIKILQRYENNCNLLNGELKQGFYSYTDTKIETFGTLKTNPSTTTTANHDLQIFEELKSFAQQIINDCKTNTETCVEQKKQEFESQHPEKFGECSNQMNEIVFYDFLENFYGCLEKAKNGCACQLTKNYNSSEIINQTVFNQKYGLVFEKISDKSYLVRFKNGPTSQSTLNDYDVMDSKTLQTTNNLNFELIEFSYDQNNFESLTKGAENTNQLFLVFDQQTKNYQIVKLDNNLFVNTDSGFQKSSQFLPKCNTKNAKHVFCLHTNKYYQSQKTVKDTYSGNTEQIPVQKEMIIKFALNLEDNTPPELSGMEKALENTGRQDFWKISFVEKTEPISKATIYFSNQDLAQLTETQIKNMDKKTITTFVDVSGYSGIDCRSATCQITTQTSTGQSTQNIEEDKAFRLIQPPLKPKIIYFFPTTNNQELFFAVQGFDDAQNPSTILKTP